MDFPDSLSQFIPNHPSPSADLLDYILCPYRGVVDKSSEIIAIDLARDIITPHCNKFRIFTDSLSTLTALKKKKNLSDPLTTQVLNRI